MRTLLLSMPDSFEHTPALTMRMPNGALASLAAIAGPGHTVAIADLILVQHAVLSTVARAADAEGGLPLRVPRHRERARRGSRNGPRMLAHTFRGTTWRSAVGLETDRQVLQRYKARRAAEREYVPPAVSETAVTV